MKFVATLLLPTLSYAAFGMQAPDYVFQAGAEGYACFRIPAVVVAPDESVLAFAEGRRHGCSDTGDIDPVMKRSADHGRTWSPLRLVWSDADNTQGNPAPVVDRESGRIHLLSPWNLGADREPQIIDGTSKDARRVFVLSSDDNGVTWTEPKEITASVKRPDWTWYATGPGSGIQLTRGEFAGRLMVACDHIEADTKRYYSHVIYSDDHGQTWELGGTTPQHYVNESDVAELEDGSPLLNMRNYAAGEKHRKISRSSDGGRSWSDLQRDSVLVEPSARRVLSGIGFRTRAGAFCFFQTPPARSGAKT